jgi:site-specific DNA-methyltransferase (cytosine-N4-specific)
MDKLLTTGQAAQFLGVSTTTINRMEKQELIKAHKTSDGQKRFLKAELEGYIRSNRSVQTPQDLKPAQKGPQLKEQLQLFLPSPFDHQPDHARIQVELQRSQQNFQNEYAFDNTIPKWLSEWEFRNRNTKTYTHGFHTYPAKFIPQVARKLLLEFSQSGETVVDMFCGSGTTLVESMLLGRNAIGIELNPLACLIARVKTTPIDPECLLQAYQKIAETYAKTPSLPISFSKASNIDYWFSPTAIAQLNALKQAILKVGDKDRIDFFSLAFSEIVRQVSLTKNGEFKLVRDKRKIANGVTLNPFQAFSEVAQKNIIAMKDFVLDASQEVNIRVIHGDSTQDLGLPDESVDFILTSPPYGDSRTTVAYGQFSRLSAQWLELLPEGKKDIDGALLGGSRKAELNSPLLENSDLLQQGVQLIAAQDEKRAREVVSFYQDLQKVLVRASRLLKRGRYFIVVIGNRTVKGINLQTDLIIADLCHGLGFTTHGILYRNIPNKRMPLENSPTNVRGAKAKTIHKESILIMRKL